MPATLESASVKTNRAVSSSDLSQEQYRYLLVLILVISAVLRFWHIGSRGLWYDESYTWGVTQLPWGEFFHGLATRAADMSLYYLLFKFWIKLGQSEFALRAFSAIFSIATVPVLAELAKRLYSRRAAISAVAIFSVHVFAIRYAQETRSYAMVTFLATLGWLQLLRAVREPSDRNWLLFGLVSGAAVYTHFIAGLNVVAQIATLVFLEREQRPWRPTLRAAGLFTAAIVPALLFVFSNQRNLVWVRPVDFNAMRVFFDDLAGQSGSGLQILLILAMFAAAIALFVNHLARSGPGFDTWAASIPVVGVCLPVIALLLVSLYQPVFVPRYLLFVVVPLVLGLAVCCAKVTPKFGSALTIILVMLFALPLRSLYREQSSQDFRGAIQYIQSREQAGDLLMTWEPLGRPAVDYYGRLDPNFPRYVFPEGVRFQAADVTTLPDPYSLPSIVASHKRIWIVYTFEKTPLESGLIPALYLQRITERTHKLVSLREFKGVRVEEYSQ